MKMSGPFIGPKHKFTFLVLFGYPALYQLSVCCRTQLGMLSIIKSGGFDIEIAIVIVIKM